MRPPREMSNYVGVKQSRFIARLGWKVPEEFPFYIEREHFASHTHTLCCKTFGQFLRAHSAAAPCPSLSFRNHIICFGNRIILRELSEDGTEEGHQTTG
jgi:hypothetical protein